MLQKMTDDWRGEAKGHGKVVKAKQNRYLLWGKFGKCDGLEDGTCVATIAQLIVEYSTWKRLGSSSQGSQDRGFCLPLVFATRTL